MTAESLVSRLENLPLGEAWSDAHHAAESALVAECAAADAKVFAVDLAPSTADAVAQYAELIKRPTASNFAADAANYHLRALGVNEPLAALFRSWECCADVAAAVAVAAAPMDERETYADARRRAGERAVADYKRMISRQLAQRSNHELAVAACDYLDGEALAARLDAARQRHEAHAQLELERVKAEQRAVARAVADKAVERVCAAAATAEDLRLKATLAEREYRKVRADALVERLRASGLRDLRIGGQGERARALYAVEDLVRTAQEMSLAQISVLEAALTAHEVG